MTERGGGARQSALPREIVTRRLLLCPLVHEDWPALHAHYGDARCTQFTFGRALTEGESWRALCSMVGHWAIRGYGPWALVEASSGVVLGAAGFWYPNDWPEPEIKWMLARAYWGHGYASEAVRAIQTLAPRCLGPRAPISLIHVDNTPSIRLALAVGARLERPMAFRGGLWHVYRHPAVPAGYAAAS